MKNVFLSILGALIVLGSFYFFLQKPAPAKYQGEPLIHLIQIGEVEVRVTLAETPALRAQGLSGKEALELDEGMLFVYKTPSKEGFWMKEMNFSIDILWIDEGREVIGFEKAVSPETFPEVFYSPREIQYVLEVPGGSVERWGIEEGDKFNFKHK